MLVAAGKWRELEGAAIGGSYLSGRMDEYSDLDLLVVVASDQWDRTLQNLGRIAQSFGSLIWSFSGEHVGVPSMLICLYGPHLLHVDLKFLIAAQLEKRVEDPVVLWDRRGVVSAALSVGKASYPEPNPQWIEDRFWPWIHYLSTKIGRGELFEAIEGLSFLRERVLGPLALFRSHAQPNGVRHFERDAPEYAADLQNTIASYDRANIIRATDQCIALYRRLRSDSPVRIVERTDVESAALSFLQTVRSINSGKT
jgi:hypothetical protein